jgi:hypothetical protein
VSTPLWRKSSRSLGQDNSDCVEVAQLVRGIGIRDSKNPNGPKLSVDHDQFTTLIERVKRAELDL